MAAQPCSFHQEDPTTVCVCVCVRERERERELNKNVVIHKFIYFVLGQPKVGCLQVVIELGGVSSSDHNRCYSWFVK